MFLTRFIAKNCIVPELESNNKAGALKELTQVLFDQKRLKGRGPALDQIMARETTESTGIGNGIAVPHARVSGLKSLICAMGRAPEGMDFMSVDKSPVHLIFLICYPPTQQTTYLNFVATLAKLLRNRSHLRHLLQAEDVDQIYTLLEELSVALENPEETFSMAVEKPEADLDRTKDAHADLILLARLQLSQEMYDSTAKGKKQIQQRMENIRALVDKRLLKHYDRLMKSRPPALVPVEGDTCQGCFMKLPSQYAQRVRQESDRIHTCNNCSRFIYIV